MGIEAAVAAVADFAASFAPEAVAGAEVGADAAAIGGAEAAGLGAEAAGLGADAAAFGGAEAAGLGADAAAFGGAEAAGLGGLGDLLGAGGAAAAGDPLAFAGADAAGALGSIGDVAGTGLAPAASSTLGIAPIGAAPIDLASTAASGGLGGLGGDVTALADTSLNPSSWLGFETIDPASGATINSGTFAGGAGGTGTSLGQAAAGGSDLAALTGGTGTSLGEAAGGGAGGAAGTGTSLGQAASGGGSVFDNLLSGAAKGVTANPLGTAVAAGGLGYNILQSNKLSANEQALMASAGTQASQGASLQSYLQSGTLPPGMAAEVANATAAAKAKITSGYAARGQPADPSKNSALAQELAQVDMNAAAMQGQLATTLLNSGLNETQMSNQLYQALIQMDQANSANIGKSIANFSGALAGGPKTIQIGGTSA